MVLVVKVPDQYTGALRGLIWRGDTVLTGSVAGPSGAPILDEPVLAAFERGMGARHAKHFKDRFRLRVGQFKAVLASVADSQTKAQEAHKLIALAGNLGCAELMEASRSLCEALRQAAPDAARIAVAAGEAADRALAALAQRRGG